MARCAGSTRDGDRGTTCKSLKVRGLGEVRGGDLGSNAALAAGRESSPPRRLRRRLVAVRLPPTRCVPLPRLLSFHRRGICHVRAARIRSEGLAFSQCEGTGSREFLPKNRFHLAPKIGATDATCLIIKQVFACTIDSLPEFASFLEM